MDVEAQIIPLGDNGQHAGVRADVVTLADVEKRKIRWLWSQKIPRGMFTILSGKGDTGKSYVTFDLAARLSTGTAWPDLPDAPIDAADVVLLAGEDGLHDVVRPALECAGANLDRIHVIRGVYRTVDADLSRFDLASDIRPLERTIVERRAALCIVNPLNSYMGRTDIHRDNEIRNVLDPLADMAERTGCAVVGVHHHRKGASDASDAPLGSTGFRNICRVMLTVAADPDDPTRRLFMVTKGNVIRHKTHLAFELVSSEDDPDYAVVRWVHGAVDVDPDVVLGGRPGTKTETAESWLLGILARGDMPESEIRRQAELDGVTAWALKQAKKQLGVQSRTEGFQGPSIWTLPKRVTL